MCALGCCPCGSSCALRGKASRGCRDTSIARATTRAMAQRDDSVVTAHSSRLDPLEQALLSRAAEQLQDAIKSTRKYRSSSSTTPSARAISPRSPSLVFSKHSVCTSTHTNECGHVVDETHRHSSDEDEEDDKENTRYNGRRTAVTHSVAMVMDRSASAKALPPHGRLASRQTTQSLSDDLGFEISHLSDDSCASSASPSVHDHNSSSRVASRYTVSEWERRGILRMSELSLSRLSQSGTSLDDE